MAARLFAKNADYQHCVVTARSVLELNALDLEEIAEALADQDCFEHRWLIDPRSGDIMFWSADTGIDGHNPVDIDDLDPELVAIDPLPSWIWYQDMADFTDTVASQRAREQPDGMLAGASRQAASTPH